ALGTAAVTDVTGAAEVTAGVRALLPADANVDPDGLARIGAALTGNFETFLGGGRRFPLKAGNRWFE
ncbi:hypothetical protein J7S33_19200, partial [Saccharothrix algeriensis]